MLTIGGLVRSRRIRNSWMHQLGSKDAPRVDGPYLDPKVFAANANEILNRR
jgi:hypothetical protein